MKEIQALIDHFGGTEQALADAVGVKQPTVHAWKTGKHGISPIKALEIEKLTGGKFRAAVLCPALAIHTSVA